jgi:transaldolase
VINELSKLSIKLNVTAIMTLNQVDSVVANLNPAVPAIVSLFAGRVADTGVDPIPIMKTAVQILQQYSNFELLWASPREVLNIYQADEIGCHIITVTNDIFTKLKLFGKDLNEYSRETSEMFYKDAIASGFKI